VNVPEVSLPSGYLSNSIEVVVSGTCTDCK
jgi:hypothetical protein